MQRRPQKATPGEEQEQRRPADRSTDRASAMPVENQTILKSLLDYNKAEMRDVCRGMLDEHGGHLRNRNGGGKTPVQFRRFSSSTPARLAEGLGPKRLSPADWRYAPRTWVPRSRRFPGLGNDRDSLLEYFCQPTWRICVAFLQTHTLSEKRKALCFRRIFGVMIRLRV